MLFRKDKRFSPFAEQLIIATAYGRPNVAKFNNLHIYIQQLIFMFNEIYFIQYFTF